MQFQPMNPTLPTSITRGDTITANGVSTNYATPTYTFAFSGSMLRTGQSVGSTNATADGAGGWTLSAQTSAWPSGQLAWLIRATDGTNTVTAHNGIMTVNPAPGDGVVSTARQIVNALDAAILARASGDEPSNYTVEGLSVQKMTLTELRQTRDAYLLKAQSEEAAATGQGTFKRILAVYR